MIAMTIITICGLAVFGLAVADAVARARKFRRGAENEFIMRWR